MCFKMWQTLLPSECTHCHVLAVLWPRPCPQRVSVHVTRLESADQKIAFCFKCVNQELANEEAEDGKFTERLCGGCF